jgi:hypothetical protein
MSNDLLEKMKERVPEMFRPVISITDKTPGLKFKPVAACLIVAHVLSRSTQIRSVPFEDAPEKRLEQIQNTFREVEDDLTLPVGAVFVGEQLGKGVDDTVLVPGIVRVIASIANRSEQDMIEEFLNAGAVFAGLVWEQLNPRPPGSIHIIKKI